MKTFKLNDQYTIECEWVNRESGFKHIATLLKDGYEIDTAKCLYENRTWEAYEYESVLHSIVSDTKELTKEQKKTFLQIIKTQNFNDEEPDSEPFDALKMVCAFGEILCDNQEEKNDWKARMLKAGLENKGLIMPEDWDTLTEDEKQKRLDGALECL